MSAVAFRPGPWEWKYRSGYYELEAADGSVVHSDGSACGEYGRDVDAPDGPNARLIAAAPDLFQAVKDLLDDIAYADLGDQCECGRFEDSPEPQSCAHTRARAALAKATP